MFLVNNSDSASYYYLATGMLLMVILFVTSCTCYVCILPSDHWPWRLLKNDCCNCDEDYEGQDRQTVR